MPLPRRSICLPKTADTSAESRQPELVFFWVFVLPCWGPGRGVRCPHRLVRFVYTYFRFWCYPSRDKTHKTLNTAPTAWLSVPPPPPTGLHVNGLV